MFAALLVWSCGGLVWPNCTRGDVPTHRHIAQCLPGHPWEYIPYVDTFRVCLVMVQYVVFRPGIQCCAGLLGLEYLRGAWWLYFCQHGLGWLQQRFWSTFGSVLALSCVSVGPAVRYALRTLRRYALLLHDNVAPLLQN